MITDLRLQHFRSYSDASFELAPGVNIIVGPNGSGKTNILEAILVIARGNSYRAQDHELIQFDQPWARLDTNLGGGGRRTVKVTATEGKSYEIDHKPYKRLTLANSLPVVLFEPDHLRLLTGGPERRRTYLDDLLEQTTPGYGSVRRQYRRALTQRNTLLKHDRVTQDTQLFAWDVRLSQLAGQIVRARQTLTEQMNDQLPDLYKKLSKSRTITNLQYQHQWPVASYESHLLKKLEASVVLDRTRGFTAVGPHREDLAVLFDGHLAQEAASRGEGRTAILALKVIELQLIEAARDITPLLLLDDVFSELDGKRRRALTDYLTPYQTFITTTDADIVLQHFAEHNVIAAQG